MDNASNRGFASSFMWKLMERCSFAIVQFVVQVALARMLSPDDFGLLAIMLVFTNIGIVVVQSGLNTALVQDPDVGERDYSTVFWMSFAVSVVLFALLFFAAPLVADAFDLPGLTAPLRVMALMLVASALASVGTARLSREMRFREVFVTSGVAAVVSGVAGVLCALGGMGVWALVVQQLGYQLALGAALMATLRWRPRLVFDVGRARTLFSFGWKLLASGLIDAAYEGLSDLIIGKQFDSASLGMVNQGKRWPKALGYLLDGSIQPVALSALSKIKSDVVQVKRMVRKTLRTYTYVVCPCMMAFAVCAEPIVFLLLGEKWLPCVPFVQLYCAVYALLPIHTTNLQAMKALGRSDLFLKLELIKKAYGIAFVLFAAFVVRDIYWIVGSYVVAGAISTFVNAAPNKRLFDYAYVEQLRDIAPAFLLALVCGAAVWPLCLLQLGYVASLVLQMAALFALYVALSALLKMKGLDYVRQSIASLLRGRQDRGEA